MKADFQRFIQEMLFNMAAQEDEWIGLGKVVHRCYLEYEGKKLCAWKSPNLEYPEIVFVPEP